MVETGVTKHHRQHYYFITVLIGIFILIGMLTVRYDRRIDITVDGRNSLHASSEKIVKQLDAPLSVTAFSRGNPQVKKLIYRLLDKYRQSAEITLTFKNPDMEIDLVKQYNITRDGELVIDYKGKQEHVADLSETSITKAIYRLLQSKTKDILFVIGHNERQFGNGLSDYGTLVDKLKSRDFDVGTIDLKLTDNVPKNTDSLVIADAKFPLTDSESKVISDYLKRGGRLLWLGEFYGQPQANLIANLGVKIEPKTVINRLGKKYQLNNPEYLVIEPNNDFVLLNHINTMLLFPKASPITILPTSASKQWQALPFLLPTGDTFIKDNNNTITKPKNEIPIALLLTPKQMKQTEKVIVIGDADFMSNQFIGFGQNMDFSLGIFEYLSASNDDFIQISDNLPAPIVMSEKTISYLAVIFMMIVPIAVLIIGLSVRAILRRKV